MLIKETFDVVGVSRFLQFNSKPPQIPLNDLKSSIQLLKRNECKATAELNVFLIYIDKGMFKQNIYANEGKFETSAQPNIINTASIVQTI